MEKVVKPCAQIDENMKKATATFLLGPDGKGSGRRT
jgi:hypothetical protein